VNIHHSRTNQRELDARTRANNDYGPDGNDLKHRDRSSPKDSGALEYKDKKHSDKKEVLYTHII